jgi:hypothetical protein
MPRKSVITAAAALGVLLFDFTEEFVRLQLCTGNPQLATSPDCNKPFSPVSRAAWELVQAINTTETPPMVAPPPVAPPVLVPKSGTTMEQLRKQPTL